MFEMPRRALLLIDVQNEYFTGKLPIRYPDPANALLRIKDAVRMACQYGVPIVVVHQLGGPHSTIFQTGTEGPLIVDLGSGVGDFVVGKRLPSAFAGTSLESWLRANDIDTLTITGFMTQNCIAATIFDAVHRGYEVEFLSDASGAVDLVNSAGSASADEIHRVFSVVFQSRTAAVLPTAGWEAVVAAGSRGTRDSILGSVTRALPVIPALPTHDATRSASS
jgi:nicotinamidase-related amidase